MCASRSMGLLIVAVIAAAATSTARATVIQGTAETVMEVRPL
jgi:hypothetical protein